MGPALCWGRDLSVLSPQKIPEADFNRVADSREWQRLLHYRAPFLRSARSSIVAAEFFLSPEGSHDARAELFATYQVGVDIESARAPHGVLKQPAICAFPARVEFLKRTLGEARAKAIAAVQAQVPCAEFTSWRDSIAAKSVSLVYSSAYASNPASMFGHTFLRLDRQAGAPETLTKGMDLFSYGVNFSASVPDHENPVKYAVWGLVGGYLGRYDLAPYYRKVNEYAVSESRDLWEYRLRFSPEDTDQLVRHLWELYSGGFSNYYFLDENCSYQILTALEAVKPDWDLSSGFILTVAPVETLKRLFRADGVTHEAAIVENVQLRASLRAQMMRSVELLSRDESAQLSELFRAKRVVEPHDSARVLDALILALKYEKESRGSEESRDELLRSVLVARAERGKREMGEDETVYPDSKRPDFSHGTARVAAAYGMRSQGGDRSFGRLSISGFEHGLLDRTHSFNSFSAVRVLRLELEKEERRSIRLSEVNLLEMTSFAAYSKFDPQKSWRISMSWMRPRDLVGSGEVNGGTWSASGGYGFGANFFGKRNLAYGLLAGEIETGSALSKALRLSPGLESGLILNPVSDRYFVHFKTDVFYDLSDESVRRMRWRIGLSQGFELTRSVSLRVSGSRVSLSRGSSAGFETEAAAGVAVSY